MADNDCNVNDTSPVPNNRFSNDGAKTNINVKNGTYVPPVYTKGTFDLSTSNCAENDSNYMASLMSESLNIAAGPVNIFPMLGVHNQGSTIDQPDTGYVVSSGTPANYNALDAFNINLSGWQSIQTGAAVLTGPAYIGYNFGTKKAWEQIGSPQERYYPAAPIRLQISTLILKQSADPLKRATQIRVEASDDGFNWHRIDVLNVPSTAQLVTLGIRSTAPFNSWRLVPTFFTGVAVGNPWEVLEIHLQEATQLSLDNIEDFILLENRARAYCHSSTMIKCTYDLLDVQSELAKFGINLPQTYIFTCSFADMVLILGRPIVIGDIVELPGEIQFDPNLKPIRKWLEVTDCGWSTEGYTINWRPNLFRFYAQPIMPSIEHKDILGVPGQVDEAQDDDSFLVSLLQNNQAFKSSEAIEQAASDAVPQTGEDPQNIQSGKPLIGSPGEYDGNDLYTEDAIPPNGEPYTIGDALPNPITGLPYSSTPTPLIDGHYHRQTYSNVASSIRPPDRLLRWMATNSRWKVVEVNSRSIQDSHKKTISRIMSSSTRINSDQQI